MKLPHASDRRREMRPAVAALVSAALRLGLHLTPEERRGQREQLKLLARKEAR